MTIGSTYKWRHHRREVAFLVLGILIGALFMLRVQSVIEHTKVHEDVASVASEEQIDEGEHLSVSDPLYLRIPVIGVDTDFEGSLGLNNNQEIEVPEDYNAVGWYEYGPMPGAFGPSVVLGHVDSYRGPAVFHQLWRLKKGNKIFIDHADGTTSTFVVTSMEEPSQDTFPTERVYGDIDHVGLRLITCLGDFDEGIQRYSHNFIVYAERVES